MTKGQFEGQLEVRCILVRGMADNLGAFRDSLEGEGVEIAHNDIHSESKALCIQETAVSSNHKVRFWELPNQRSRHLVPSGEDENSAHK
jgi:hypothetical protein